MVTLFTSETVDEDNRNKLLCQHSFTLDGNGVGLVLLKKLAA